MNGRMKEALALLEGGCTCAIVGEQVLQSTRRGVAPLLEWLQNGEYCHGAYAADKVVGKAAAYLYVLLKVRAVYEKVLSVAAAEVFARFGIAYAYDCQVPAIYNRTGTGFCPMEQAVWAVDDPQTAYIRILAKLEELKK